MYILNMFGELPERMIYNIPKEYYYRYNKFDYTLERDFQISKHTCTLRSQRILDNRLDDRLG